MDIDCGTKKLRFTVGIDVGGTNTDAVLYETGMREIVTHVKIPTDHDNYAASVEEALRYLLNCCSPSDIISLNISTTLSTNAILEGKGSPVALILIGYEDFPHITADILKQTNPCALLSCGGGHNGWGIARAPLECDKIAAFAAENAGAYFAVSSYYSPRNPEHETAAAQIVCASKAAGVSCGHQTARSRLNSVKRTVTAFLNSSLIAVTERLISAIEESARRCGLSCPIMFLRSDSSLVSKNWCARFPIETIFSGPAASMRGAAVLDDIDEGAAVVADMGGTSTDIGLIREGRPVFSEEGASIGSYQTMIPSLEIYSAALGGDSLVRVDGKSGALVIGPQRVVPAARGGASCAYTPTDALCTLGLYDGNKEASCIASETLGKKLGLSAAEFASAVRNEVSTRLEALFAKKCSSTGMKKICVGAPAAAYVEKAADIRVPHSSGVASAVGAAASSLSLSCSVAIIHSFFDDLYYAFLPDAKLCAPNLYEITEKSKARLDVYLRRQSQLMGIEKPHVSITEEREYIGREQNEKSLAKITITGEAVVQNI